MSLNNVVAKTSVLVSVDSNEQKANAASYFEAISTNEHFIVFNSAATNLVAGDTNGVVDLFLRDTTLGNTTRISVASDGGQANGNSYDALMSDDGRHVAFESNASNLVAGDTNAASDVFLRDTVLGTTTLVTAAADGGAANGYSTMDGMSGDGRYILFESLASNLVAGDTNGAQDIFLRDTVLGTTIAVSATADGTPGNGASVGASMSDDGRYIVFSSAASNLVAGDTNGVNDIFLLDTQTGGIVRLSIAADGSQANGASILPKISPDGSIVTYQSAATNLVANDTNGRNDVFKVLLGGTTLKADLLLGSSGTDSVSYADSTAAVTVDLTTGQGHGGYAEGDRLHDIENIVGSRFADTLIGSAGANALQGGDGNDVLRGGAGADVLDGGIGIDTASYAGSTAAVVVSLTSNAGNGGDAQGDTLAGIENLVGSALNDYLYGSAGANSLAGGAGADYLDGRGGVDTADYSTSSAGVNATLSGISHGGDAEGDRLVNIENLRGSAFADHLTGDAAANRLDGGAGIDTVHYANSSAGVTINLAAATAAGGYAQGDVLLGIENVDGSQHRDGLTGNAGANVLQGLGGDDTLRGGAGADRLIGGAGIDTVSYTDSAAAVTVSLASHAGSGGDAQGDYIEAENVNGSRFNDAIYGDAGANVLNGWAGRDILEGRGGADRFVLSAVAYSAPGANADRITDFSHAQGDRIDLSAIDARTDRIGDQAFHFIGSAGYSYEAGQLHYAYSGSTTIIGGDIDGDGGSDFNIVLTGRIALVAGDFVL